MHHSAAFFATILATVLATSHAAVISPSKAAAAAPATAATTPSRPIQIPKPTATLGALAGDIVFELEAYQEAFFMNEAAVQLDSSDLAATASSPNWYTDIKTDKNKKTHKVERIVAALRSTERMSNQLATKIANRGGTVSSPYDADVVVAAYTNWANTYDAFIDHLDTQAGAFSQARPTSRIPVHGLVNELSLNYVDLKNLCTVLSHVLPDKEAQAVDATTQTALGRLQRTIKRYLAISSGH